MYPKTLQAQFTVYKNKNGEFLMTTGEARTAKWLDLIGLDWIYNNRSIYVGHNISYVPDFQIPELRLYIEVKNKNPELVEPYEFEKIRLFHEMGNDIYIMRKPPIQVSFIHEDFKNSNGMYYSNKFIHDNAPTKMMILKPSFITGRPELAGMYDFDGLYYVNEAYKANNCRFETENERWDEQLD